MSLASQNFNVAKAPNASSSFRVSISNKDNAKSYLRPLETLDTTYKFKIRPDSRLTFPESLSRKTAAQPGPRAGELRGVPRLDGDPADLPVSSAET